MHDALTRADTGDRNIVATGDLIEAIQGATALIFVLPHQVRRLVLLLYVSSVASYAAQFIPKTCEQMQGKIGKGAKGISLIKVSMS